MTPGEFHIGQMLLSLGNPVAGAIYRVTNIYPASRTVEVEWSSIRGTYAMTLFALGPTEEIEEEEL